MKNSDRNLPGYTPAEIVIEFGSRSDGLEVAELPAEVNQSTTFPDWQKIVPIGLFVVSVAAAVMLYSYVYSRRSKERKKYSEGNLLI
ncbi:Oidioi.mRNA.OKI2018_I69.XSR.g14332.t1.cds [Oikopleura dioica]|uniref:Oidioi.mRNA.OKI2018_I69.XSR.g14332.t1.cds n=1 Tax=Oikopleura dioica TaxID=34765 RepID=A0ABN7SEG6_OIKDI|nr:Oidioi.mRNA.OKI2018_I69.XSR.g14332.t1.cds [Oikopleura dioica]